MSESSELSAEKLRRMQILQMADLGTARREKISTADSSTQARAHLADIESKRLVDERDKAQLSEWANLHAKIGDTHGMEELNDINSGQSHRANLHAMLHPNGSQPRTYANHPYPAPSAGRGGGVMGRRGRGGFVAPPPSGPANIPPPPTRGSLHANFTRSGRPGPRARSTTMWASIHLDPALNCNNDDSDARDRGRGRGRGKGKGKGRAQEHVHIQPAPSRPQRPPPAINFATRISEPGDFMSSFQSRRATETYKKPIDTIPSAPMQKTASAQEAIPPNEQKAKALLGGTPKKKTVGIPPPSKPASSPVAASTTPSRVVPIEKTAPFHSSKAQATAGKISQPHIGPYLVETPSPSPRVVPVDKTISSKSRKAQPGTPKASRPHDKAPPVEAPSSPPSRSVPVQQSAKSKKVKDMATGLQASYPAVVAIAADEIQWKVPPGEQPRKKGTSPSEKPLPLPETKKTPVPKAAQTKDNKQNVSPDSQKEETKQKAQSQDLLSGDDSPVNTPTTAPHYMKTVAIQSPGTAELAGLKFAERPGESVPVKSIDEVIAPKTSSNKVPEAQSRRNDQSQALDGFGIYGPQIVQELRELRRHIRTPQDLATTRDIERILESKLLQLVPAAYAPPASAAPASSEIESRLGNLVALVEYLSTSQQGTNAVEASSAARRDLTPFEGHRSPPPPSSSSNSPPSADKRTHKVCVPGLSPTKSESSDIISQFESLQVSDKLAAPLQPQRVVPVPVPRLLGVPKRTTTSDAFTQAARAKEATKKPQTLNDSIFAGPVGPVSSSANVMEPNSVRSQTTTRGLSASHPNIPKQQDVQSTGARTIGPAPYKPRVIGPAPSAYEPTTLRDVSTAHVRTVSAQHFNTENRPSLNVANRVPSSMSGSSGPASQQTPNPVFSMPDPATIPPKVKAPSSFPPNRSRR
ncbi:hypothetical protein N7530_002715 [Penicillium desertorum]|uniref:Uncharacterized protein n=1 Tax=Penicillium desertorum TaxID=1303715 RepID=A0A9W9X586_9EURO|nr:hypothetical protein N7530_002715 [Penicillium desertorum]